MINAIADLGLYEKYLNPELTNFDILLEDSFDGGKYSHLFLIEFEKKDDRWKYAGIDFRENSASIKAKLLYKRGSPRGTDRTPTAKVAKSITGTFKQKLVDWFEQNKENDSLSDDEKTFINSVLDGLKEDFDKISSDLEEKAKLFDKGGIVLSLLFREGGKDKFIGDFSFFENFVTEESKESYRYSKTYKKHSFSKNSICSVCNKVKDEVFGYFTSPGFYTVDKPGMITGGFRHELSWKNYPVCINCALNVEMGLKMMDENLSFSFYGLRYYLIPKTINDNEKNEIIGLIVDYKKSPKINDEFREKITNAEDEVFDLLKDENNRVSFNLVFYSKPQKGVFRILSSIEEVLPSRIRKLFYGKEYIDNFFIFKDPKKEDKQIFRFNFGTLREFFPNSKIEGNYDESFLHLVNKIFSNSPIDYQFLIISILKSVRKKFIEENEWLTVIRGFMLVCFLNRLKLFQNKGAVNMDSEFYNSFKIVSKEEFEAKTELFFQNFNDFFKSDTHRAVFLMGVLSQFLLNAQQNERGAKPFRSKLKGLRLDSSDVKALLPKIEAKLEDYTKQYGKNYSYKSQRDLVSKYFISAKWDLTVDEINFVFVIGMNLSKYFKINTGKEQEGSDE